MASSEISANLLPPPVSQGKAKRARERAWFLMTAALCVSVLFNLAFWLAPHNHRGPRLASDPPQWAEALKAAERAASQLCSGHGNVFVDTVGVNADGTPQCECEDCFTGQDCSVAIPGCIIDGDSGDPTMFEAYWRANEDLGTVIIPGWYRMSYRPRDGAASLHTEALIASIRELHTLAKNAVTEGRYIVVGTGSMQLINAAVQALAQQNSATVSHVTASAPYYSAYRQQTEMFQSPLYKFSGEPDRMRPTPEAGATQIELIASPNNPTGLIQEVPGNVSGHVVFDHAYYWPHLTPITKAVDHDIMLFTLSKITGHAGSRVGWAIVKDPDLYLKLSRYVMLNTIGVSHEAQLRASQLIQAGISSYSNSSVSSGRQGLFHYGHEVLQLRWTTLRTIFKNTSRFTLQEFEPQYCSFFGKMTMPAPGYAWIHCNHEEDVDCWAVMASANITGRQGSEFGSDSRYVRLSLLKRQSNFDSIAMALSNLISQT